MELSKQLKAAILSDFVKHRKEVHREDWAIDINNFVEIYRPGTSGKYTCTGHFIHELMEFCHDKFGKYPCLSCFDEQIRFFL